MPITHSFVSGKADDADNSLVQPSDWNADHVGEKKRQWSLPLDDVSVDGSGTTKAYDIWYDGSGASVTLKAVAHSEDTVSAEKTLAVYKNGTKQVSATIPNGGDEGTLTASFTVTDGDKIRVTNESADAGDTSGSRLGVKLVEQ